MGFWSKSLLRFIFLANCPDLKSYRFTKTCAHFMFEWFTPTFSEQRKVDRVIQFEIASQIVSESLRSYPNFKFFQRFWLQTSLL